MEYHRDAPAPSGLDDRSGESYRYRIVPHVLGKKELDFSSVAQRAAFDKIIDAVRESFLKGGGTFTYLRLGKWYNLILEPLPMEDITIQP